MRITSKSERHWQGSGSASLLVCDKTKEGHILLTSQQGDGVRFVHHLQPRHPALCHIMASCPGSSPQWLTSLPSSGEKKPNKTKQKNPLLSVCRVVCESGFSRSSVAPGQKRRTAGVSDRIERSAPLSNQYDSPALRDSMLQHLASLW